MNKDTKDMMDWINKWEQVQKEFVREERKVEEPVISEQQIAEWKHILYGSQLDSVDEAVNVAYAGSEGYGKADTTKGKLSDSGKKKVNLNNPIGFNTAGPDQEDEEGKLRVTDNWNDGEELRMLSDLKVELEKLERKFHESEVMKRTDRSKIKSELDKMRKRVRELSQELVSDPTKDVT